MAKVLEHFSATQTTIWKLTSKTKGCLLKKGAGLIVFSPAPANTFPIMHNVNEWVLQQGREIHSSQEE